MRIDPDSLSSAELEAFRRRGGFSVADAFPESRWQTYTPDGRVIQPTDEFAGYLAGHTGHDELTLGDRSGRRLDADLRRRDAQPLIGNIVFFTRHIGGSI